MNVEDKGSGATYIFAGVILAMIGILIVPLPPMLLDMLFALDLVFAGMVLIISIVIHEPIEFAAFSPILLVATLFRLSLDVSATRLILSMGHVSGAVGALIPAFGAFVLHGNIVVGLVIFAIVTTIQFVVIASGAGRVAEVAARFTLDALPGKQMAVDAELHAGAIDLKTAKERRRRVQLEADFFGAMDGAGKFVKGDAIAALVIVILNLVGGLAVGVMMHGMAFDTAAQTYALPFDRQCALNDPAIIFIFAGHGSPRDPGQYHAITWRRSHKAIIRSPDGGARCLWLRSLAGLRACVAPSHLCPLRDHLSRRRVECRAAYASAKRLGGKPHRPRTA